MSIGPLVRKPVPTRAVDEPGHLRFVNNELVPLLKSMVGGIELAPRINVLEYGARPGTAIDQAPFLQSAINDANAGSRIVYVPGGIYRIETPLDFTACQYLRFYGDGVRTRFDLYLDGREFISAAGAFGLCFEDFYTLGPAGHAPSAAFLFGRTTISGCGLHNLQRVRCEGFYTHSTVTSMSSEANTYHACIFENQQPGDPAHPNRVWAVSEMVENDTGIVPTYGTLANPQLGGNTVHRFTDCCFTYLGNVPSYGGCMRIGGQQATVTGCFFTANVAGECGLKVVDTPGFHLHGGTGETEGADNGIVLSGVIQYSTFNGHNNNTIYGADGSSLRSSVIHGKYTGSPYGADLYNVENSVVDVHALGVSIRNICRDSEIPNSSTVAFAAAPAGYPSLPVDRDGTVYRETTLRSDGKIIHRHHDYDGGTGTLGFQSRNELGQARAYVWQGWQGTMTPQTLPTRTTFTVRTGSIVYCVLDRNIGFDLPTDILTAGASTQFDIGCQYTIIFKQTAAFTATPGAGFAVPTGWAVTAVAGDYTRLDVIVMTDGTHVGW